MSAVVLALAGALALAGVLLVAWWLRDERCRLAEREVTAGQWEQSLRRREEALRAREKALWWAERAGPRRPHWGQAA